MKNLDTNSLEYYIAKAKKAGVSSEDIKKEAILAGWSEDEVKNIFFKKNKKYILFRLLFILIVISLFLFIIIVNNPGFFSSDCPTSEIKKAWSWCSLSYVMLFLYYGAFLLFEFVLMVVYSLFLFFVAENRRDAITYFFVSLGVSLIISFGVGLLM